MFFYFSTATNRRAEEEQSRDLGVGADVLFGAQTVGGVSSEEER